MNFQKSIIVRVNTEELDIDINDIDRITIDYNLEDIKEFQVKKSSEALKIRFPATLRNQRIFGTANNISVERNEKDDVKNFSVEVNGEEIFVGKCILSSVQLRGNVPLYFEINAFGNNADWIINLKEATLYDVIKDFPRHVNSYESVENTWNFPNAVNSHGKFIPYVFAPAKYNFPIDIGHGRPDDYFSTDKGSFSILNMMPSISIKYLLEESFKIAGFSIKSEFLKTEYFKRLVMPWTFGDFITTEGSKYDIHKFLAVGTKKIDVNYGRPDSYVTITVDPGLTVDKTKNSTAFENNKNSFLNGTKIGRRYYSSGFKYCDNFDFGELRFTFVFDFYWFMGRHRFHRITLYWVIVDERYNVIQDRSVNMVYQDDQASGGQGEVFTEVISMKKGQRVYFSFEISGRHRGSSDFRAVFDLHSLELKSISIPPNGEIMFENFTIFQKYKTLDFIRGLCDMFNLSIQTNPISKEVLIEPTHDYIIGGIKKEGFFTENIIDWTERQDYSKESTIEFFNNASRNYIMKFKDDSSDIEITKIKDHLNGNVGSAKYVFSNRFKEENKIFENRFFAPTIHGMVTTAEPFGMSYSVQMVVIKTSDDSNTKNTISTPKIAYYKGKVYDAGKWVWRGKKQEYYPFMFAVNYNPGGENDPILSYTDENIEGGKVANGLLRTFFLQRMAIINNGQILYSPIFLSSSDINNWYHREYIGIDGNKWELINIKEFSVIKTDNSVCTLRKWVPITNRDINNVFPSKESVKNNSYKKHNESGDAKMETDMRYFRLMEFLVHKQKA